MKNMNEVFEQLEEIRSSGAINMYDRKGAIELAKEWGFSELSEELEERGKRGYMTLLNEFGEWLDKKDLEGENNG